MQTTEKLTAEQYHADYSRVSNSMLSVFRQSRRRYFERFVAQTMPATEPTAAMRLGSLVHALVLEPDSVSQYATAPNVDRRTKAGKEEYAAFLAESASKTVVDADDWQKALAIRDAVWGNSVAKQFLAMPGDNEVSHYWTDPATGIECKCRYDRLCADLIPDLKTSHDASPRGFAEKSASLGYHRQAAHYRYGWTCATGEVLPFVFIVVCTEPPYDVGIYELDEDALQLGEAQNESALRMLKTCHKTGDWREPWQKQVTQLKLPKWTVYADEWSIIE